MHLLASCSSGAVLILSVLGIEYHPSRSFPGDAACFRELATEHAALSHTSQRCL